MTSFKCFWCENEFPLEVLTRDHLIPKASGGNSAPENLKACCRACNGARSKFPCHYFKQLQLIKNRSRKNITKTYLRSYQKYNKQSPVIRKQLEFWSKLELERLGHSPSSYPFVWHIESDYTMVKT
jgi:hypothetical protein